jgi:hypothetical protein
MVKAVGYWILLSTGNRQISIPISFKPSKNSGVTIYSRLKWDFLTKFVVYSRFVCQTMSSTLFHMKEKPCLFYSKIKLSNFGAAVYVNQQLKLSSLIIFQLTHNCLGDFHYTSHQPKPCNLYQLASIMVIIWFRISIAFDSKVSTTSPLNSNN